MATAISIVLIITALFMIVTVLLQSSDEDGIGALSGRSDSYFSKTKAKTFEAKLALGQAGPGYQDCGGALCGAFHSAADREIIRICMLKAVSLAETAFFVSCPVTPRCR